MCIFLATPGQNADVSEYVEFSLAHFLQLILLILGIRTITILMKKFTKFSTFEKQLLSLLILKCVYALIYVILVS